MGENYWGSGLSFLKFVDFKIEGVVDVVAIVSQMLGKPKSAYDSTLQPAQSPVPVRAAPWCLRTDVSGGRA